MTKGFFLAVAISGSAAATAAPTENTHEAFTLSVNGIRTGYAREERLVDGNGIVERASTTVVVRELGHRAHIERALTLHEKADGTPSSLDYRFDSGTDRDEWHAVVDGDRIIIHWREGTHSKETRVEIPRNAVLSPRRAALLDRAEAPTFSILDPARRAFVDTAVSRDGADRAKVAFAGRVSEEIRFDANRHIVRIDSTLFGQPLAWTPCERDCEVRVAAPLDVIGGLVVRSPVRIPDWYKHRSIRYVISRTDGRAPDAVETAEQTVVRDGERAIVTICDDCGHELPPAAADLERFLKPNAWVRSDDAQIRRIARGALGGANVKESMRSLAQFVRLAMRGNNDFLGYADAVTALRTGSGDCTEFAVLLAALARARGIPARVAVGLAYSDRFSGRKDVFSPHMWVQAWDGARWTSYDAALEGFDSTHIALAIGDGDPGMVSAQFSALPTLRIDKAGVVRSP